MWLGREKQKQRSLLISHLSIPLQTDPYLVHSCEQAENALLKLFGLLRQITEKTLSWSLLQKLKAE